MHDEQHSSVSFFTRNMLDELTSYIQSNLHRKLTIPVLAKVAGVNQLTIKQAFKQITGCTAHHYIIEQRIQTALALLKTTDKPIKDIASIVGYSERNFYAIFKQHTHATPHSIRINGTK